jgi:hypothetical protein
LIAFMAAWNRLPAVRKKAILAKAAELNLPLTESGVMVLDAAQVACWVSSHEALALNALFKAPGWNVIEIEQWKKQRTLRDEWISGAAKVAALDSVRAALDSGNRELRIEGPGGIGKTRLALQALDIEGFRTVNGLRDRIWPCNTGNCETT